MKSYQISAIIGSVILMGISLVPLIIALNFEYGLGDLIHPQTIKMFWFPITAFAIATIIITTSLYLKR